jgi:hypothetical protein
MCVALSAVLSHRVVQAWLQAPLHVEATCKLGTNDILIRRFLRDGKMPLKIYLTDLQVG